MSSRRQSKIDKYRQKMYRNGTKEAFDLSFG